MFCSVECCNIAVGPFKNVVKNGNDYNYNRQKLPLQRSMENENSVTKSPEKSSTPFLQKNISKNERFKHGTMAK